MIKDYRIQLHGCDDTTILDVSLDDIAYQVIKYISELSEQESVNVCMPTMTIDEMTERHRQWHEKKQIKLDGEFIVRDKQ